MHNSAAPYDDNLPNAGRGCRHMKQNAFLVTASNQLTINPKGGKKAFSGIPTRIHHCLMRVSTQFICVH